jgi:hypothetical protein
MQKQKQTKKERKGKEGKGKERKGKERKEVVKQTKWPADKCQRVVQRQD